MNQRVELKAGELWAFRWTDPREYALFGPDYEHGVSVRPGWDGSRAGVGCAATDAQLPINWGDWIVYRRQSDGACVLVAVIKDRAFQKNFDLINGVAFDAACSDAALGLTAESVVATIARIQRLTEETERAGALLQALSEFEDAHDRLTTLSCALIHMIAAEKDPEDAS